MPDIPPPPGYQPPEDKQAERTAPMDILGPQERVPTPLPPRKKKSRPRKRPPTPPPSSSDDNDDDNPFLGPALAGQSQGQGSVP